MTFEKWFEINGFDASSDDESRLRDAFEAGQKNPEVDWHKNTPEDQPESGRDIWLMYYDRTNEWVGLLPLYTSGLYDRRMSVSEWAYAELPDPPEQSS